jgi:hypothetical protein
VTDLIEPDAQGGFLAPLGIWPRPVDQFCGAVRTDLPDLPCVLPPHWDGQHEDVHGGEWETVDRFVRADGEASR